MTIRRTVTRVLAMAAVGVLTALPFPRPHAAVAPESPHAALPRRESPAGVFLPRSGTGGLGPANVFVTVVRGRQPVRLDPRQTIDAVSAVWRVLESVDHLAPQAGGPGLLAMLRLNDYLLDVTVWRPQAVVIAGRRLEGVSAIVVPFTGTWRHRVLIDREGRVQASPTLVDSPELAALERLVESSGGRP
jgi:hypothetical protein